MILLWFQARIQQKEETIAKYQELLKQARDDMQDMNKRHEQDLKNMQLKIHQNTDSAFNKFKEAARDLMAKQQLRQPATEKQVSGTKLGTELGQRYLNRSVVQKYVRDSNRSSDSSPQRNRSMIYTVLVFITILVIMM